MEGYNVKQHGKSAFNFLSSTTYLHLYFMSINTVNNGNIYIYKTSDIQTLYMTFAKNNTDYEK